MVIEYQTVAAERRENMATQLEIRIDWINCCVKSQTYHLSARLTASA